MSSIKVLPRVLSNLSDAKKLYQLQANILAGLNKDLINIGEMLVKATDDSPEIPASVTNAYKAEIKNVLSKMDKHIGAAKLMSVNFNNDRNVFDLAADNTSDPNGAVVNQILFQNTVFNTSMADNFIVDKYILGTKNLGGQTVLAAPYSVDITVDGAVNSKGTMVSASAFGDDLIPGDVVIDGSNYYQLVMLSEDRLTWNIVAMPGQTVTSNTGVSIEQTYNFLSSVYTYWYNGESDESDIVCSRSFRSLNNRVLLAQEQIGRLSDKVALKIQALESYCDFISSLYNATQAQC